MGKQLVISKDIQIKAAYLFIIIHSTQVGVGIAGYPRFVFIEAKQDSWISILITGLILHLVIATMIYILRSYDNLDLTQILNVALGSILGKAISLIYVLYFFILFLSVIINYIEFVQVFIFPKMPSWFIATLLLTLVWYTIQGGIRVVVGACFIFFVSTLWMIGLLAKPISIIDYRNYFPVFEASWSQIFSGVIISSYTFLGFEILWAIYPYILDNKKAMRYSQLSVVFTVILYLYVTIVAIGYFSPRQLEEKIWPLLTMFKIISFPAFERFDLLLVAIWVLVILPNCILLGWAVTSSCKRVCGWKQKHSLVGMIIIALIIAALFEDREFVNTFTNITAKTGIVFGFLFPFFLLPFAYLHRRKKKKGKRKKKR